MTYQISTTVILFLAAFSANSTTRAQSLSIVPDFSAGPAIQLESYYADSIEAEHQGSFDSIHTEHTEYWSAGEIASDWTLYEFSFSPSLPEQLSIYTFKKAVTLNDYETSQPYKTVTYTWLDDTTSSVGPTTPDSLASYSFYPARQVIADLTFDRFDHTETDSVIEEGRTWATFPSSNSEIVYLHHFSTVLSDYLTGSPISALQESQPPLMSTMTVMHLSLILANTCKLLQYSRTRITLTHYQMKK